MLRTTISTTTRTTAAAASVAVASTRIAADFVLAVVDVVVCCYVCGYCY
jgi:hypothetical protein